MRKAKQKKNIPETKTNTKIQAEGWVPQLQKQGSKGRWISECRLNDWIVPVIDVGRLVSHYRNQDLRYA